MIQLKNVSKQYKTKKAVHDISFSVKEGETVVLLGTSGCGKTTTLRMINRLIEATSGEISIDGRNILDQKDVELRRGIGYVLQHHGLFPHYTVAENIAIVPNLLKWDRRRTSQRIDELMEKLRLPAELKTLYPNQLSGGQQQRVGLARALAADPPILLMDEPLGALDPVTRTAIRKEFKTLDELKSKTIVMVTHDIQEAFQLGDRVCLMDAGRIIQFGKPSELLFSPSDKFVSSFLAGQQFQLGLEALSIEDIWEQLPEAGDTSQGREVDSASSLWDALEAISNTALENHLASDGLATKQISSASIMAAFSSYKKSAAYE